MYASATFMKHADVRHHIRLLHSVNRSLGGSRNRRDWGVDTLELR